ncbi:MAG: hypothetical protein IH602_09560 [Bryobacteraceae bacterium]|nr:hypothetical protein [Bryobacteraceae bacterium]
MTERMNNQTGRHWSRDEMVSHLYGLDPAEGLKPEHLESCELCHSAWLAMNERRRDSLSGMAVSEDLLRRQRRAVFARIEKPRRPAPLWGLVPAAMTALLLVGVSFQSREPVEHIQTAAITASDRELFNELSELMQEDTPRAAAPIRALFVEQTDGEAQ